MNFQPCNVVMLKNLAFNRDVAEPPLFENQPWMYVWMYVYAHTYASITILTGFVRQGWKVTVRILVKLNWIEPLIGRKFQVKESLRTQNMLQSFSFLFFIILCIP